MTTPGKLFEAGALRWERGGGVTRGQHPLHGKGETDLPCGFQASEWVQTAGGWGGDPEPRPGWLPLCPSYPVCLHLRSPFEKHQEQEATRWPPSFQRRSFCYTLHQCPEGWSWGEGVGGRGVVLDTLPSPGAFLVRGSRPGTETGVLGRLFSSRAPREDWPPGGPRAPTSLTYPHFVLSGGF